MFITISVYFESFAGVSAGVNLSVSSAFRFKMLSSNKFQRISAKSYIKRSEHVNLLQLKIKLDQAGVSNTQSVIKSKFITTAYTKRLENEHNVTTPLFSCFCT